MNKEQQVKEMLLDIPQKIVTYGGIPAGQHLYCEQRQEIAEALYNAGYRKTFTSDLASDTQKTRFARKRQKRFWICYMMWVSIRKYSNVVEYTT